MDALSTFNQIVSLIRNAPEKFAVFFGAGACVSAGLPLGDKLRDLILGEVYGAAYSSEELKEIFHKQFPESTSYKLYTLEIVNHFIIKQHGNVILSILKNIIGEFKTPPTGYSFLKQLCEKQILCKIITVNFDELLEEALKSLNPKIIGISSKKDENIQIWGNLELPNILKLHGTISQTKNIQASFESVEILSEDKARHLRYLFENHSIIFIGYSARDLDVEKVASEITKNKGYKYKFYFVTPSLKSNQKKFLKFSGSEENYINMKSDVFLERVTAIILGEDKIDSPMHQSLKERGHDVKRVLWTPGKYIYNQSYQNVVEAVIFQPNAIPDTGPPIANVGEDTHNDVIELSKKYYPSSEFWITYIYSNRDMPRCKTLVRSVEKYQFGGSSWGSNLPLHLLQYI